MAMSDPMVQLGCGRSMDDVWDHIDTPPDTHELACAYCSAARRDLAGLVVATQELRDHDADDGRLQASPTTIDRILSIARTEVRRGRRLPLVEPGPDGVSELTVSEQAVTAVVRRVGDSIAAFQVRRCSVRHATSDQSQTTRTHGARDGVLTPLDPADPQHAPAGLTVSVRVSVDLGVSIPLVVERFRTTVTEVVDREVGLRVTRLDVSVEDVNDV